MQAGVGGVSMLQFAPGSSESVDSLLANPGAYSNRPDCYNDCRLSTDNSRSGP